MAFKLSCLVVCILYMSSGTLGQATPKPKKKICDLECRQEPMELSFVIDASSSIWPVNFTDAKWFVSDFVDVFEIGPDKVRVSAVTFGSDVNTADAFGFDVYPDKKSLREAITELEQKGGNTETGEAIKYARKQFFPAARPGVKKVCVVLTDGNSQDPKKTAKQALMTRESGVEVYAIGIGNDISGSELRNIAGVDSQVFKVDGYNLLGTLRSALATEICDENIPDEIVCRDNPIDISLVIDASVSIGRANFSIGLEFLKQFVQTFEISPQRARFSVITYGRGTYNDTAFDFDAYQEEVSLVDAIGRIPYTEGDYTDTGKGIRFMREGQMLPKMRAHAVHIAVVLTDGNSQDWPVTQKEAAITRDAGISVFAIGVGHDVSREELDRIAGQPDRVFTATDYTALDTIKDDLDIKTCEIATLQFQGPRIE